MSLDGLVSGCPVPLLYAHNMDDPRSPLNVKTKLGSLGTDAALTARSLKFESAEAYGQWIAADALHRQTVPFDQQLQRARLSQDQTLIGKIKRKLWQRLFYKPLELNQR